jgi:hypothetical protein
VLSGPGCCSPRRRLPRGASSRSRAVGRRRRGRHGQQARHGVGRRCPAGGVHPSGFGVRDPAVQPSGVRSPGVVVQRVRRPAVRCPPIQRPAVWCPAVQCLAVRPDASVSFHLRRWPGDRDHRNGWRLLWLPGRRRLDRRSRRPGRGRRCRSRVGQWEVAGGPGRRGGCGPRRPRLPLSDQAGQAGVQSPSRRRRGGHGCRLQRAVATPPRGCRPRAGYATTVGGRRRA